MPSVISVNTGRPHGADWAGLGRTSIDKRPVTGPVGVTRLGLAGDQVSDTDHHGGIDQAVYAYALEDLDWWAGEVGRPISAGGFGENLTTVGLDLNAAVVGTRWQVGTTVLEVSSVRTPCNNFKSWMGLNGFDPTQWVRRFARAQRPGPYLRVLQEGEVAAGDEVVVAVVPDHGVTVEDMFVALYLDRSRLPELAAVADLAESPRRRLEEHRARSRAGSGELG